MLTLLTETITCCSPDPGDTHFTPETMNKFYELYKNGWTNGRKSPYLNTKTLNINLYYNFEIKWKVK